MLFLIVKKMGILNIDLHSIIYDNNFDEDYPGF